jgi:hypothetical protein
MAAQPARFASGGRGLDEMNSLNEDALKTLQAEVNGYFKDIYGFTDDIDLETLRTYMYAGANLPDGSGPHKKNLLESLRACLLGTSDYAKIDEVKNLIDGGDASDVFSTTFVTDLKAKCDGQTGGAEVQKAILKAARGVLAQPSAPGEHSAGNGFLPPSTFTSYGSLAHAPFFPMRVAQHCLQDATGASIGHIDFPLPCPKFCLCANQLVKGAVVKCYLRTDARSVM